MLSDTGYALVSGRKGVSTHALNVVLAVSGTVCWRRGGRGFPGEELAPEQ